MASCALLAFTACGVADPGEAAISQLDPGNGSTPSTSTETTRPADATESSNPLDSGDAIPGTPAEGNDDPSRSASADLHLVTDVMAEFDHAITALAASPLSGADSPTPDPVLRRWHAVVEPGSTLDTDLRTRFLTDLTANRTLYSPPDAGPHATDRSWIHKVVGLSETQPAAPPLLGQRTISFEYCGYSPAVGRDHETGELTDGDRATYMGTGTALVVTADRARITALVDRDLRLLEPTEDNPC